MPGDQQRKQRYKTPQVPEDELEELIEDILHEDDVDNDGYVDYAEFMVAQRKRGGFEQGDKPYSVDRF